ncbi:MAG: TIGR02147 family protein [Rhizobacter sp.]|nr:TIGR02147 family protein [Bacteriovorax sp.]
MISPLSYQDYKEYLRELSASDEQKRGFQSSMAKAMNCQAAYLSQTLRGKVELTEDHGVKLVHFLKLNPLEGEYFLLLLRLSRATTPELRKYLEERRVEMLKRRDDLENKVQAKGARDSEEFISQYFSSWIPTAIHISTSSHELQSVESLVERFSLSIDVVKDTLIFLERYNLVKRENGNFIFSGESIHLPKASSSNEPYQVSLRTQVIKSIQEEGHKKNLHFSSVFTMDKKSYKEILEICNKAIEESHKVIHSSGTEEVYALCMDLFKVV